MGKTGWRGGALASGVLAGALAVFIACSSNNGGGGGFPFSGPSCTGALYSSSCWSCAQSKCGPGCVTSDCNDYFSCYCGCSTTDNTCADNCSQKLSPACNTCLGNLSDCLAQQCSSECGGGSGSSGGGSGSSSGGVGSTTAGCDETASGMHFCFVYTNLMSDQVASLMSACSSAGGTSTTSCPGGVGTCKFDISGYVVSETYYCGDASTYQMTCQQMSGATWTPGPGGPTNCD